MKKKTRKRITSLVIVMPAFLVFVWSACRHCNVTIDQIWDPPVKVQDEDVDPDLDEYLGIQEPPVLVDTTVKVTPTRTDRRFVRNRR